MYSPPHPSGMTGGEVVYLVWASLSVQYTGEKSKAKQEKSIYTQNKIFQTILLIFTERNVGLIKANGIYMTEKKRPTTLGFKAKLASI